MFGGVFKNDDRKNIYIEREEGMVERNRKVKIGEVTGIGSKR